MVKNLAKIRKSMGYTQQKLADSIGSTRSAVAMWETSENEPDTPTLASISQLFNVSIDELVGNDKKPATEIGNGLDEATIKLATKLQQLHMKDLQLLDAQADFLIKRRQENQD